MTEEQKRKLERDKARMKIICAYCGKVKKDGPGPVSHGACKPCADKALKKELEKLDTCGSVDYES